MASKWLQHYDLLKQNNTNMSNWYEDHLFGNFRNTIIIIIYISSNISFTKMQQSSLWKCAFLHICCSNSWLPIWSVIANTHTMISQFSGLNEEPLSRWFRGDTISSMDLKFCGLKNIVLQKKIAAYFYTNVK